MLIKEKQQYWHFLYPKYCMCLPTTYDHYARPLFTHAYILCCANMHALKIARVYLLHMCTFTHAGMHTYFVTICARSFKKRVRSNRNFIIFSKNEWFFVDTSVCCLLHVCFTHTSMHACVCTLLHYACTHLESTLVKSIHNYLQEWIELSVLPLDGNTFSSKLVAPTLYTFPSSGECEKLFNI